MRELSALLVHGYLGSPGGLELAARTLAAELGPDRVRSVLLPGHGGSCRPPFEAGPFVEAIRREAERCTAAEPILVGHSTGGNLILAAARALARPPALVVLAGTPPRIDAAYAARWAALEESRGPGLDEMGALVSLVNGLARDRTAIPFPVLVLQGEDDPLVPAPDAERWRERGRQVRVVRLPGRGHPLLADPGDALVGDVLRRAVRDARMGAVDADELRTWQERAPEVAGALERWPPSLHHLRGGPAGRSLAGRPPDPSDGEAPEPTILDVSITTRCDLACRACARIFERPEPREMSLPEFARLIDLLPHALRVVLVGLGEPLLHPEVVSMVRHAADRGRRVSLVTNGMTLERDLGRGLLDAGLASLTVSIDAVSEEGVARTRRGADPDRILGNLRAFLEERSRSGRTAGVSVFTALAADTVGELEAIVEAVAPLGVDALMASDLNFPENAARSLHRGLTPAAGYALDRTLRGSLARGLPIVSVQALEELDVPRRFREFLLLRGAHLAARSGRHLHCRSPWQTLPVDPEGEVTFCDCQPGLRLGNALREPFSAIWDGEAMRSRRRAMRSEEPPEACLACPRF